MSTTITAEQARQAAQQYLAGRANHAAKLLGAVDCQSFTLSEDYIVGRPYTYQGMIVSLVTWYQDNHHESTVIARFCTLADPGRDLAPARALMAHVAQRLGLAEGELSSVAHFFRELSAQSVLQGQPSQDRS